MDSIIVRAPVPIVLRVMYSSANSVLTLQNCHICGNSDPQVVGDYVDDGGNTIMDECPVDCPGDYDASGYVDVGDLLFVISNWQSPYAADDLLLVISRWNSSCP